MVTAHLSYRYERFLPLGPSLPGFILMFLAISSLVVPKHVLIATALINAPYTYLIGLVLEYAMILLISYLIYGKKNGRIIFTLFSPLKYPLSIRDPSPNNVPPNIEKKLHFY